MGMEIFRIIATSWPLLFWGIMVLVAIFCKKELKQIFSRLTFLKGGPSGIEANFNPPSIKFGDSDKILVEKEELIAHMNSVIQYQGTDFTKKETEYKEAIASNKKLISIENSLLIFRTGDSLILLYFLIIFLKGMMYDEEFIRINKISEQTKILYINNLIPAFSKKFNESFSSFKQNLNYVQSADENYNLFKNAERDISEMKLILDNPTTNKLEIGKLELERQKKALVFKSNI